MSFGEGYGGYGERDRTDDGSPAGLTTTTRLPDGEGAGRTAPRPGRSVVPLVGVVVLLIAAIAFANQGGDDGDSADGEPTGGARPTAPTGRDPVQTDGDIPSGFPQSRQGAESAAANYAVALVSAEIIKPDKRDGIVKQVFAPAKADAMRTRMDRAYSSSFLKKLELDAKGNPKNGLTYISRTSPMGTKVVKFSKDTAKLDVWCTGLYGLAGEGSKNPVTSDWFTMRLTLEWVGGDWKVSGFKQKDGPAPVEGDNRASSADEIADAVGQYGGFTYGR